MKANQWKSPRGLGTVLPAFMALRSPPDKLARRFTIARYFLLLQQHSQLSYPYFVILFVADELAKTPKSPALLADYLSYAAAGGSLLIKNKRGFLCQITAIAAKRHQIGPVGLARGVTLEDKLERARSEHQVLNESTQSR